MEGLVRSHVSPLDAAWSVLKADPEMDILEMASHSRAYPGIGMGGDRPAMTTMNPIIARLIRERNEREGRGWSGSRGEIPHHLERDYFSDDKRPYTEYGKYGVESMPGPRYFDQRGQSKDALAERGVEPGDKFSGDYVVKPLGQDMHGSKHRRIGENRAHENFPYGSRAGGHRGPRNVKPGSPMAQMYNMAPVLERLPEGLQPEWMDEFREGGQ